jgi:hypothetical protein
MTTAAAAEPEARAAPTLEERVAALEKQFARMVTWSERKNKQVEHLQQQLEAVKRGTG